VTTSDRESISPADGHPAAADPVAPADSARPGDAFDPAIGTALSGLASTGRRTAGTPQFAPSQLVAMQRSAGNLAVAGLISRLRQPSQLSPRPNTNASLAPVLQRSTAVDQAIQTNTVDAISALTDEDLANASVDDRIKMIDTVLAGGGGDILRRLWDSFGAGIEAAANGHTSEWQQSMSSFPDTMRDSREVKTLEAAFKDDITSIAQAYLTDNTAVVKQEMERLGIPEDGSPGAPNAAQDEALQKTQADASKLSEVQKDREQLKTVEIAYHRKVVGQGSGELPPGGADNVENQYDPVYFDPDNRFDAASQPTDYEPGIKSWEETNQQHVELSNVITAYLTTNPALYALVGSDTSGQAASQVAKVAPEQARKQLGDQLQTVLQNIASTRSMVPTLALQMTPIQQQMLSNSIGASAHLNRDWSTPFLKSLGQDVAAQQEPGPWWQQLGMATLEMAAYVVSSIATGGIGPLLLAGGQAAISVGKYQALEAASHANVTPDTVLINNGAVDAAAVEATIAVVMAFLMAVSAARAAFAARIAAPTFEALANELGEDVARTLLMELSIDAVSALKDKLGAQLLKDLVGANVGGSAIQKLADAMGAAEIQTLLQRASTQLGPLLKQVENGTLLSSLLEKCPDAQQLGRLLERVPDPQQLDTLLGAVGKNDLAKLEQVLQAIGEPGQGTITFNIGGELETSGDQVVINPGREAMSIDRLRQLKPDNLIVQTGAERIPFPDGCAKLVVGRKLPNSIDWNSAAKEFARVLASGGKVQISIYGPGTPLRTALALNGFSVQPPVAGVAATDLFVVATKQ